MNEMGDTTSERGPDSKVNVANMGPTWVLSAPGRPDVGPMNLAIRGFMGYTGSVVWYPTPAIFSLLYNTLRPRQNGRHFPDDIFKCIFLNENLWISNKILLKFVPEGPINNIPALGLIMACHLAGAKPLSAPMLVSLLPHICITRPKWDKHVVTFSLTGAPQHQQSVPLTCVAESYGTYE